MNKNLDTYIKVYDAIPKNLCDSTVAMLKEKELSWTQHTFYNSRTNTFGTISAEKELDVSFDALPANQELMDIIWNHLSKYLSELDFPWYNSWSGFTQIRFNRYNETRLMAKHCDHIQSMFDGERKGVPILSVVGVLNDDYKGGEFVMFDDTTIELSKGALLIFPSNFLYPHKVLPVTKGSRYTFVSWVW